MMNRISVGHPSPRYYVSKKTYERVELLQVTRPGTRRRKEPLSLRLFIWKSPKKRLAYVSIYVMIARDNPYLIGYQASLIHKVLEEFRRNNVIGVTATVAHITSYEAKISRSAI
jgi:hypothetical protein